MDRIKNINSACKDVIDDAKMHWNTIAKPLHSLGVLEDYVSQIAGITNSISVKLDKRCVVVLCADNGVVCEGVTQSDSEVTAIVAEKMLQGDGNINSLAAVYGADVIPIDVGMISDVSGIVDMKISRGTKNIVKGPAMTYEQAQRAVSTGIDIVKNCQKDGYKIIITGEMGIGNTTTSSAIASLILDETAKNVTGRGAGIDDNGYKRKIAVINKALKVNKPDKNRPLDIIAKIGGYDIAAMTGVFLGGAVYHIPIVIDGFISAVAATLAIMINPFVRDYMLCSHVSKEPAGNKLLENIGFSPVITAGMCLGEGTGGIMLLPLLDGAISIYNSSHSFEKLTISQYEDYDKE